MKLIKVVVFGASVLGAALGLSAVAIAGGAGGCSHGAEYGDASLANNDAAENTLLASEADPKWLALQKRLALEERAKENVVQVPN